MPFTEDDLRAVFEEHVADAPDRPNRRAEVERGVRRARRRRTVAGGAAVAGVLAVTGVVVPRALVPGSQPATPALAPRATQIGATLPQTFHGLTKIAGTTETVTWRKVQIEYAPRSMSSFLAFRCEGDMLMYFWVKGGGLTRGHPCPDGSLKDIVSGGDAASKGFHGSKPGEKVTFEVVVVPRSAVKSSLVEGLSARGLPVKRLERELSAHKPGKGSWAFGVYDLGDDGS